MLRFLHYLVRRVILFALICLLAAFTTVDLFPYIRNRFPLLIAILITYILLAYLFIPTLIRIFRIFDKPNRIPTCAMTGDGWASDPVNIAVLATSQADMIRAMEQAGWQLADQKTIKNILKIIFAMLFNHPYPTAPFSNLYLFGRKQDLGFQIAVGNSPRRRHHVRFWQVTQSSLMSNNSTERQHHSFWHTLLGHLWQDEQMLWVGACIYDSGPIAIMWRNGQLNHRAHPNTDVERSYIIETLRASKVLRRIDDVKSGEPYKRWGQGIGAKVISDGYVKLCTIRQK